MVVFSLGLFLNLCSYNFGCNVCQPKISGFKVIDHDVPQQLQMQEHNGKRTTVHIANVFVSLTACSGALCSIN